MTNMESFLHIVYRPPFGSLLLPSSNTLFRSSHSTQLPQIIENDRRDDDISFFFRHPPRRMEKRSLELGISLECVYVMFISCYQSVVRYTSEKSEEEKKRIPSVVISLEFFLCCHFHFATYVLSRSPLSSPILDLWFSILRHNCCMAYAEMRKVSFSFFFHSLFSRKK